MKNRQYLSGAVGLVALFGLSQGAEASLVGDEIDWSMEAVGLGVVSGSAVVGPGIEASGGGGRIQIDVQAESFDVLWNLTGVADTGAEWIITISDLDWVGRPGRIVDVTKSAGLDTIDDISFGADFVSVQFPRLINPPALQTFSFDIDAIHDAHGVPDGGASAVGLGVGLLSIAGLARRMRG